MLENIVYTFLGAALVTIGVFIAALAERVRALGAARTTRQPSALRTAAPPPPIEVVEAELVAPREGVKQKTRGMADEVIAALVAAGYKKPAASEATWSCTQTDRLTIERWTAAALRRAMKGGVS